MIKPQNGDIWRLTTFTNPLSADHYLLLQYRSANPSYGEQAWKVLHLETGELDTVWIDGSQIWTKVG